MNTVCHNLSNTKFSIKLNSPENHFKDEWEKNFECQLCDTDIAISPAKVDFLRHFFNV